jgi:hypothetical protein
MKGAIALGRVADRTDVLEVACGRCGRHGRYNTLPTAASKSGAWRATRSTGMPSALHRRYDGVVRCIGSGK